MTSAKKQKLLSSQKAAIADGTENQANSGSICWKEREAFLTSRRSLARSSRRPAPSFPFHFTVFTTRQHKHNNQIYLLSH
jgi:hypothetical protein